MPLIATALFRLMDVFEDLPLEEIEQVASLLTEVRSARGAPLCRQVYAGDAMRIVTVGRIKLFTVADSGVEKILTDFGDGDCLGEMALLTGAPRSASAAAEEDARPRAAQGRV